MIFRKLTYYFILTFFLIITRLYSQAQGVEIKTDRNQILIGERIQYDLLVSLPAPGYTVNFGIPDSIPHFETIERAWFDTTRNANGSYSLHRKFIFTSFDSGSWYIPSLPVTIGNNAGAKKILTDSVLINVGYAAADSTIDIRDIKPIIDVTIKDYFWYYVIGGILTAIILVILIVNYINYRKKKPLPVLHSSLTPYEEAQHAIKELSKNPLENAGEVKEFHSQISFIIKRYYSRLTDTNLMNKTTGGLLMEMKLKQADSSLMTSIAGILRAGDAVKFAKHIPTTAESKNCLLVLEETIDKLEKDKPLKS